MWFPTAFGIATLFVYIFLQPPSFFTFLIAPTYLFQTLIRSPEITEPVFPVTILAGNFPYEILMLIIDK